MSGVYYFNTDESVTSCSSDSAGGGSTCCTTTTSDANLSGNDNTQKVFNYFIDSKRGLSPMQSAAIAGNFYWESGGMKTDNPNPSTQATGIAHWLGGRKDKLQANPNWRDLGVQLDYAWGELNSGYKSTLEKLKTETSIDQAVVNFEKTYEVSGDTGSYPHRIALAKKFLSQYGGTNADTTSSGASVDSAGVACSASLDVSGSGYMNPLRDIKNLKPLRIDQGVDYGGEGPVYSIGSGTVNKVWNGNSGWPGNNYISYTLTDGAAKGKIVYFAENCKPRVKDGDTLTATTVICDMTDGYPFTETGWGVRRAMAT